VDGDLYAGALAVRGQLYFQQIEEMARQLSDRGDEWRRQDRATEATASAARPDDSAVAAAAASTALLLGAPARSDPQASSPRDANSLWVHGFGRNGDIAGFGNALGIDHQTQGVLLGWNRRVSDE